MNRATLPGSSVCQQVAKAEWDWQAPLVLRGPRGATLTAAGALLARRGRVVAEQLDAAAVELAALLGQLSLRLRVGAFQAPSLHLLPPALTALCIRHPDADVFVEDLLSEHGVEKIAAGRLDLAVIASWDTLPDAPPRVAVHTLLADPMVVVLPDDHPLATRHPAGTAIRLEELRDESWVAIAAGHPAREQFHSYDAAAALIAVIETALERIRTEVSEAGGVPSMRNSLP
ncbi:LysR family transcriptional regulator [Streptomyces sp. NPDC096142]|uniref:LysR family transcriptional regulator n=1 Tax=Streptomyces sp. NPDC096142 TaxID=3366077 RepID=UPI0037F6232D